VCVCVCVCVLLLLDFLRCVGGIAGRFRTDALKKGPWQARAHLEERAHKAAAGIWTRLREFQSFTLYQFTLAILRRHHPRPREDALPRLVCAASSAQCAEL